MKTLRMLSALGLLAVAQPAAAAFFSHGYDGMITAIDREARKLTVTDHRGNVDVFALEPDAEVRGAEGEPATFEQLASYDEVRLTYAGENRVSRIDIRPPRKPEERLDDAAPTGPP